jgi:hypothetical protein
VQVDPCQIMLYDWLPGDSATMPKPFGSTRSQVRILSPRLTFHRSSNLFRAETRVSGPAPSWIYTGLAVQCLAEPCVGLKVLASDKADRSGARAPLGDRQPS